MATDTLPSQKIIRGQIADNSGHTDFEGTIDEAMDTILHNVTKAGKWVYLNGAPFIFKTFGLEEQNEVRNNLLQATDPTFLLTGKLQGGKLC